MSLFYLKKWYFDLVTPGGDAIYSYFIIGRIAGFGLGLASTHLRYASGEQVRASVRTGFAVPDARGNLSLGRHSFIRNEDRADVRLVFENITLDLCYATVFGGWRPTGGGLLWNRGKRFLLWEVVQSLAEVKGTITAASGKFSISGVGYQDIVETSIPPWKLPIAELIWGRAHCGGHVVVFNQVRTREGEVLQSLLLGQPSSHLRAEIEASKTEGFPPAPGWSLDSDQNFSYIRDDNDREAAVVHRDFRLALSHPAVLEESPIVTAERFRSRISRRIFNGACGRPLELKMLSAADLEIKGIHHRGWAIHERVTWNWPQKEPE